MTSHSACRHRRRLKPFRRGDWHGVLPALGLLLLPKCPACLATWLGAFTGLGLSVGAAAGLRVALLVLCAVWLLVGVGILLRRFLIHPNP